MSPTPEIEVDMERKEELVLAKMLRACSVNIRPKMSLTEALNEEECNRLGGQVKVSHRHPPEKSPTPSNHSITKDLQANFSQVSPHTPISPIGLHYWRQCTNFTEPKPTEQTKDTNSTLNSSIPTLYPLQTSPYEERYNLSSQSSVEKQIPGSIDNKKGVQRFVSAPVNKSATIRSDQERKTSWTLPECSIGVTRFPKPWVSQGVEGNNQDKTKSAPGERIGLLENKDKEKDPRKVERNIRSDSNDTLTKAESIGCKIKHNWEEKTKEINFDMKTQTNNMKKQQQTISENLDEKIDFEIRERKPVFQERDLTVSENSICCGAKISGLNGSKEQNGNISPMTKRPVIECKNQTYTNNTPANIKEINRDVSLSPLLDSEDVTSRILNLFHGIPVSEQASIVTLLISFLDTEQLLEVVSTILSKENLSEVILQSMDPKSRTNLISRYVHTDQDMEILPRKEPGIEGDSSHSNTQGSFNQECEVSEESCETKYGLVYEKLSEGEQGQNSVESCEKERKNLIYEEFIDKEKDLIPEKSCEEICDVVSKESCEQEHDLVSDESSEKDEIEENTDTVKHNCNNSHNSSPMFYENHQTKDLSCDYNESEEDFVDETENVDLESGKEDVKEIYSTSDTNAFTENLSNTDISETYVSEYDEDEWGSDWGEVEENEYEFLECDEDEYKVETFAGSFVIAV